MKITHTQHDDALLAMIEVYGDNPRRLMDALGAALAALGIEVTDPDVMVWVSRTWVDVREGDIIRPPGAIPSDSERHAAIVAKIGPVNHWHAAPNASQYRPNESPMEWSAMRVTLRAMDSGQGFTPEHGMRPDAGVEIKVTRAELAAIEAMGGWTERVGVYES